MKSLYFRSLVIAIIVCLLWACQTVESVSAPDSIPDTAHSVAAGDSQVRPSETVQEHRKIIVSFPGFFNSKTLIFKPQSINYSALLKRSDVYLKLQSELDSDYDVAAHNHLETFFEPADPDFSQSVKQLMKETLEQTRHYLFTGQKKCVNCDLSLPVQLKIATERDRIVLFTGLETAMPEGGLRSGLTAVAFTGDGQFLGLEIKAYNFQNYNSSLMVADCLELLSRLPL